MFDQVSYGVRKSTIRHDILGRRTAMNKSGTMFARNDALAYGYNSRGEVVSAVAENDPAYNFACAFDAVGNRVRTEELADETVYASNVSAFP